MSRFLSVTGTINNVSPLRSCSWDWCNCASTLSLRTKEGPVDLVVYSDTYVLGSETLRPGHRITAFYDADAPVPLIYPPQYRADLIAVLRPEEDVAIGYFDDSLTAIDNSLRLNLYQSTIISTMNGQAYLCSPANHYLLVYYTATTRSIPPQTAPGRIIVLCQAT